MEKPINQLRREMLQYMGIVSYQEQERLIDVARRCSVTSGLGLGAGWAVLGSTVPGHGTVAGFLAGWLAGTASCMAVNQSLRAQLQQVASGTWH